MGTFGNNPWGQTQWGGAGAGGSNGGGANSVIPQTATITTSTPVIWSNGNLFNGWLLLGTALPTGATGTSYPSVTLWGNMPPQPLPQWIMIPIVGGVIDQNTTVFQSIYLDPPGCRYVAYWLDTNKNTISPAGGASPSLFDITTASYVITQPYLLIPASPNIIPAPQNPSAPVASYLKGESYAMPANEIPQGTVDGSNTIFTVSHTPNYLMFFVDGQLQAPGTYISQGTSIICSVPPAIGSLLTAIIF